LWTEAWTNANFCKVRIHPELAPEAMQLIEENFINAEGKSFIPIDKSYPDGPHGPKHPGNRQLCDKRGRPDAGAR
jgi:hypothetical protein